MINTLRALMEKANNMQEQMGIVSTVMSKKKNQKEMQQINNNVTEMINNKPDS